jgi:hypothetical protein
LDIFELEKCPIFKSENTFQNSKLKKTTTCIENFLSHVENAQKSPT